MAGQPPDNSATVSATRAMARADADALSKMEEAILPETWELNRWMLASLLALNSAAAAAVYSSQDASHDLKIFTCRLFVFGAISALASGLSLTVVLQRLASVTSRAQRYWTSVAIDGIRSPSDETTINDTAAKRTLASVLPQFFLFLSTGLFIGGIFSL